MFLNGILEKLFQYVSLEIAMGPESKRVKNNVLNKALIWLLVYITIKILFLSVRSSSGLCLKLLQEAWNPGSKYSSSWDIIKWACVNIWNLSMNYWIIINIKTVSCSKDHLKKHILPIALRIKRHSYMIITYFCLIYTVNLACIILTLPFP